MKPRLSTRSEAALTLLELVVVVVILVILWALLLTVSHRGALLAKRINCVNTLKSIGCAYRIWEGTTAIFIRWAF